MNFPCELCTQKLKTLNRMKHPKRRMPARHPNGRMPARHPNRRMPARHSISMHKTQIKHNIKPNHNLIKNVVHKRLIKLSKKFHCQTNVYLLTLLLDLPFFRPLENQLNIPKHQNVRFLFLIMVLHAMILIFQTNPAHYHSHRHHHYHHH